MSDEEYDLNVMQGELREAHTHPPNLLERYALDLRDARRELAEARGLLREHLGLDDECNCDADYECISCRTSAFLGGE